MVFLLVLKMNLFFIHYFSVPVAVPNMVWVEAYNSTALMVHWTPVPNTRDSMKGRLRGYKVNDCPLFLPMHISKGFTNHTLFKISVVQIFLLHP